VVIGVCRVNTVCFNLSRWACKTSRIRILSSNDTVSLGTTQSRTRLTAPLGGLKPPGCKPTGSAHLAMTVQSGERGRSGLP
jgi:hypothetical protein